jgi:N-acetylneuraminic acid mutarotase
MKSAWKLVALVISLLALLSVCGSSGGDNNPPPPPVSTHVWTWVSGSDGVGQTGLYFTKGVAAPGNRPGARWGAASWIDSQDEIWLFGGWYHNPWGYAPGFNDLWKYDGTNWTWVSGSDSGDQAGIYGTKGTADPSNVPGARVGAASWIDSQGKLWLFGGWGLDSANIQGYLNDLWNYDLVTQDWTWVSGSDTGNQAGIYGIKGTADPLNIPGARDGAVSWIDSQGKLWLFGGSIGLYPGMENESLNDLWSYDPATQEWTWVSGKDTVNLAGIYGTKGTADPTNVPGARSGAVSWIDSQGKLWLFGGLGIDSALWQGPLNDLWKYDPTSLEWTWVSGGNKIDQKGTYGTKGTAAPSNVPGARSGAVSWIDSQGKLWLFGGNGMDSYSGHSYLNDMWNFDPTTLEWVWVSGSDTGAQAGIYGTRGTADLSNVPGARWRAVSWIDSQGKLWLFGGLGWPSSGGRGCLNDLWQYFR